MSADGRSDATLVVVGAALGTGRWLAEHLLPHAPWREVLLIDSDAVKTSLRSIDWRFEAPLRFADTVAPGAPDTGAGTAVGDGNRGADGPFSGGTGGRGFDVIDEATRQPIDLPDGPVSLWIAVPTGATAEVAAGLIPRLPGLESVFVCGPAMVESLPGVRTIAGGIPVFGVHALFDATMPSLTGQILYLVPDDTTEDAATAAPAWLDDAIERAGGILKHGSAAEHDAAMREVQERAHRVLVDFADAVTASGLDLEHDLWESRTPLFETLFGLAVRVLDSRETTITAEELARVRDRFPGSLYDTIRGSAAAAVTAAQAKRLAIAAAWRSGAVVGLRTASDAVPRIGRIVELTSTTVALDELLAGKPGSAALLHGPGIPNAARLGVAVRTAVTTFGLGHVELVTGDELETVLDELLAHLPRDVRFLVPESVAGAGVLRVVDGTHGLRDCALVDEVVRTGQRSVVIRMGVRADLDPAAVVEALQERVGAAYRWPSGLALELATPITRVVHLGPAGTFSEDAARQCAENVGADAAELVALPTFDDVIGAVGDGVLAVLPISSSASGLVTRAVQAILAREQPLVAGGMVDVAVRFDAYTRGEVPIEAMRGATVYSHPQGLAQCSGFIRRWGLIAVPCDSTAAALQHAADSPEPAIALAGVDKGTELGLRVLEREVDDLSGSITRFIILGAPDAWGAFAGGSRPTLRRLWVGDSIADATALIAAGGAGFAELLSDADGRWLLVTSRTDDTADAGGARALGALPWSPRTPVVRASA
jgi:prephenate dehydratase